MFQLLFLKRWTKIMNKILAIFVTILILAFAALAQTAPTEKTATVFGAKIYYTEAGDAIFQKRFVGFAETDLVRHDDVIFCRQSRRVELPRHRTRTKSVK